MTDEKPRLHRAVRFGVDRCFKHNAVAEGCSGRVPLCRTCLDEFQHGPEYLHQLVEAQYVLCPGCAWDEALLEYAQRELDSFLATPPKLEDLEERLV